MAVSGVPGPVVSRGETPVVYRRADNELGRVQGAAAGEPEPRQPFVILTAGQLGREAAELLEYLATHGQIRGQQTTRIARAREEAGVAVIEDRQRRPMLLVDPRRHVGGPVGQNTTADGAGVRMLVQQPLDGRHPV